MVHVQPDDLDLRASPTVVPKRHQAGVVQEQGLLHLVQEVRGAAVVVEGQAAHHLEALDEAPHPDRLGRRRQHVAFVDTDGVAVIQHGDGSPL